MEWVKRTAGARPAPALLLRGSCPLQTTRRVERAIDLGATELLEGVLGWDRLRPTLEHSLVKLEVAARNSGPRRLRVDVMNLPGLGLSWLDASGVEMHRTEGMVADGPEGFTLSFALAGRFRAVQGKHEAELDANSGVLLDGMRASSIMVPDGVRFVGVRLGSCCRDLVSDLLARGGHSGLPVISGANPAFAAIRSFVRELADPQLPLADSMVPLVRSRLLALVEAALSGYGNSGALCGLRDASIELIRRHLDDPTLSPADLAGWLGVTEEQVLCAIAGDQSEAALSLFHAVLTRLRVVTFAQRLRDPASGSVAVEALSLETGFHDEKAAREAFVAAFGVEPDVWRSLRFA